ncbi:uncharacterized protein LOC135242401 isoform X2 [Anguilla rostrata]|uniref:uncharacterized protein LOC135242401 isoform X2 n=1 Tax=Anguilla rostrata TaxID=7938 RepID=UPI0030D0710F
MADQIVGILDELKKEEFERFTFYLNDEVLQECRPIPQGQLEGKNVTGVVKLMKSFYGNNMVKITLEILKKIDRNDLIQRLESNPKMDESIKRAQNDLKTHLRRKCQCIFEGLAKHGHQILLNKIYTELYITEGGSAEVNNEHEVRQIETASKKQTTQETAILCNDIFKPLPGQEKPRTVLTKGIAGIGKTVSVQKFILDWAEGKANQDIDFIFTLPFRDLNLKKERAFSLMQLLQHCFPQMKEIKSVEGDEVKMVFIFDGLDECRLPLDFQSNKDCGNITESSSVDVLLTNLIKGNLFPSALLWITSRPAAASQIPPECVHQVTEVRGFNDPQKEEYFRKRIKDENQASRIISHIKSSRSLYIMCHIPVFCWISVHVLETILGKAENGDLPKTLTEMYTHFLLIQTNVKNQKYHGTNKISSKEMSASDTKIILKLGQLAFLQLEKGNLIFYDEDLRESGIDVSDASVYSGVCTEIFKEECGLYQEKVYCFVHLSIQEYLAALFVFHSCVNKNRNVLRAKKSRIDRVVLSELHRSAVDQALERKNGHLDLFLRFLLGLSLVSVETFLRHKTNPIVTFFQRLLTQTESRSQSIEKTVQYIKERIRKEPSAERTINLFHCLNELNDNSLVQEIQSSLRSGKLSDKKLEPDQCSALAFVLLMSEEILEFDLKTYNTLAAGHQRLLPVIRNCRKAKLNNCELTQKCCNIVASALQSSNSPLRDLELRYNNLGDSGVKLLCAGLRSPNCKLRRLGLNNCELTQKCCNIVASALQSSNSPLRDLDLSYNNLGDSGVELLCAGLRSPNCKLQRLGLNSCDLTEKSGDIVASALQSSNSPLRDLDLSYNNLGDSGVELLCAGLMSPNCKLQRLGLNSCDLTEKSGDIVASALQSSNSPLRDLDLSYNKLGDSGVKLLCAGLMSPNCKLQRLGIRQSQEHSSSEEMSSEKLSSSKESLLRTLMKLKKTEKLKLFQSHLSQDCPECFKSLSEDPSELDKFRKMKELFKSHQIDEECTEREQEDSKALYIVEKMLETCGSERSLKITLHILRNMKQKDLVDSLERGEQLNESIKRAQQALKTHLKQNFECIFEGLAKQNHPTLLKEIYTEVYITEGGSGEVNNEHEVRQIETASKRQTTQETAIFCNDIFKPLPGQEKPIRTVLTKGIAGIGKTVSVQKFILDWAEGKANQDIDFIFTLPFRDLNLKKERTFSLMQLLQHCFPKMKAIKSVEGDEVKMVFIFDGLDECRLPLNFQTNDDCCDVTESSSVDVLLTNLIKGNLLPSALLWITSRPAAASQIPREYVHQVTEVRGFNDPQKEEYFRKRINDENQASRIISHIKSSRSLYIMCHIPVFCWISVRVLETILGKAENGDLPKTLTEMYTHFLLIQTNVKNQKYQGTDETDPKKMSAIDTEIILKLGQLAFQQLEKGNLIFYKEDLKKSGIDVSEASVYSGLCTEIFKEECGLYQVKVYCFVHLSIQEYLAALFVFHSYVNENRNVLRAKKSCIGRVGLSGLHRSAVDQALKSKNGHLDLFLRFLLGLSLDSIQTLLGGLLTQTGSRSPVPDPQTQTGSRSPVPHTQTQTGSRSPVPHTQAQTGSRSPVSDPQTQTGSRSPVPHTQAQTGSRSPVPHTQAQTDSRSPIPHTQSQAGSRSPVPHTQAQTGSRSPVPHMQAQAGSRSDGGRQKKNSMFTFFQRLWTRTGRRSTVPDPQTQTGSRSPVPDLQVQTESRSNVPDPQTQTGSRSTVPDLQVQTESRSNVPDPQTQTGSRSTVPDVQVQTESRSNVPDPQTQTGSRSTVPDPQTQTESRSTVPDPQTQTGSRSTVPDPQTQTGSRSPVPHTQAQIDSRSPVPHMQAQAGSRSKSIEKTVQYIKETIRMESSAERTINLFHCLNELNDNSLVQEIQNSLRSGKLSDEKLEPHQCSALAFVLLTSEEILDEFDLKTYNTSAAGYQRLVPVVRSCRKAKLNSCDLTMRSCDIVASALQSSNSPLRDLDLSYNNLGDSGVELLCAGLRSPNCKIQRLGLNSCDLTEKSCNIVASALQSSNSPLRDLDLSYNNLGDSGVELLCAVLMTPNCKLQRLGLGWCNLTEGCCDVLASVLRSSHSELRDLELRDNELQDSGVRALSAGLEDPHCKLQRTGLSGCRVTQRGCDSLASALCSNPSHLRELDLRYNHPGDSGVRALSAAKLDTLTLLVDHGGENRTKPGPRKYGCQLTLDTNTANRYLSLSKENRKVTQKLGRKEPYPDHPERFKYRPQVVCRESVCERCYWEAEFSVSEGGWVYIAVTYKGISRKGRGFDCMFGYNKNSWSLECIKHSDSDKLGYSVRHNNYQTDKPAPLSPYRRAGVCDGAGRGVCVYRVGVCVDRPAGTLSFYSVSDSDTLTLLHRFHTHFTQHTPLCAGLSVWRCSVSLC